MARGSDINQRIVLTGADEVRRHLEEIAASGQKAGNQTRAALLAATSSANSFTTGARSASASSGQMQFALQNLSFQVNDVATSLASGGDVMRVFAQQGGQVFQAFQQGGGFRAVFGSAASAIGSMLTPMRLAAGGALALVAAIGALIARQVDTQTSAKQFNAQLQGLGKSSRATGEELEQAARRLKDIGIGISDARKLLSDALAGGLRDPKQAERLVRIGNDLNRVFGEGTLDKFLAAAAKGGPGLREFAERLNIVPAVAADVSKELDAASQSAHQFNQSIQDALTQQTRSLVDNQLNQSRALTDLATQSSRSIVDLTRQRGDAEQEIRLSQKRQQEDLELASARRVEDINRESARAVNEMLLKRNQDNAKALAEHNKQIEAAAQAAAEGGDSIITQIENRVKNLDKEALGPTEQATRALGVSWQDFLTTMTNSQPIQSTITDLTNLFKIVTDLNGALKDMAKNRAAAFAAGGSGLPGDVAFASIQSNGAGGLIRGPGTGASDSIISRLSNGEFVVNAMATRMNLPILRAMNAFNRPIMPRLTMPRGFAMGGLVSGGGGSRTAINLNIGGETFGLESDAATAQRVIRFARKKSTLSAGRRPSTA